MNAVAHRSPLPPATAPADTFRMAWPVGAKENRLPAKPMRHPDTPALIWRAVMRRTWWRLHRDMTPQPVSRPVWC